MKEKVLEPHKDAAKVRLAVFDFDGVFTDNTVYVSQDGTEYVRCSRSDGFGLKKLKNLGISTFVLSTEPSPIVKLRCEKMKVDFKQGLKDKVKALLDLSNQSKIPLDDILFLGNDINDIDCMNLVGVPVAVKDAYPEVKKTSKFITYRKGGYGAVREVCDWIENSRNFYNNV